MPAHITKRYNLHTATGDWDSDAAGTDKTGSTLWVSNALMGSLSALVTVDAETDTLTITGRWQVSNDKSTYVDIVPSNNAANVIIATGTAGADAAVTKAICAPDQIFGYKYCRYVLTNGVATGAATDTYSIGYSYVPRNAATTLSGAY